MKKYCQLNLMGISPDTRVKLKILSLTLDKRMHELVELMTDRLWKEKQDLISAKYSQLTINKEVEKILKSMIPR